MNNPRLRLDIHWYNIVGELAYKPIAITQFRPFAVYGWFIQRRSHMINSLPPAKRSINHVLTEYNA